MSFPRRLLHRASTSAGAFRVPLASNNAKHRSFSSKPPDYAFAFDIDGVLLHGRTPLAGAREALHKLQENKIPYILLTNGGGKSEGARTQELSRILGVPITEDMFVQSHTPFRGLVSRCKSILAVGGPEPEDLFKGAVDLGYRDRHNWGIQTVAERYGFESVHTVHSLLSHHPEMWPFEAPQMGNIEVPGLAHKVKVSSKDHLNPLTPIDAVLVFNDPRHWGPTLHVIIDLLLSSGGKVGTYSAMNGVEVPGKGKWRNDGQPELWWSNNDLWWQGEYHLPRLGQGGFRAAVEGVWTKITGERHLEANTIGKPFAETYKYAEGVLNQLLEAQYAGQGKVKTVYMVGDNPRSDIEGANAYGWYSLLVESGVFRRDREGGEEGLQGVRKPARIVRGVLDAVEFGMARGGG